MGYSSGRNARDVEISNQGWGSDFVADLFDAFGFDFVSFNPGASSRGIEESVVNYNDNRPEVIQTGHKELSVAIAHGYAKATGEPASAYSTMSAGRCTERCLYNAYLRSGSAARAVRVRSDVEVRPSAVDRVGLHGTGSGGHRQGVGEMGRSADEHRRRGGVTPSSAQDRRDDPDRTGIRDDRSRSLRTAL